MKKICRIQSFLYGVINITDVKTISKQIKTFIHFYILIAFINMKMMLDILWAKKNINSILTIYDDCIRRNNFFYKLK